LSRARTARRNRPRLELLALGDCAFELVTSPAKLIGRRSAVVKATALVVIASAVAMTVTVATHHPDHHQRADENEGDYKASLISGLLSACP
jgi:hypothetical protein